VHPYTHFMHRHTFAAWAAARAAQRGLTTVSNLKRALESCGVVEFLHSARSLDVSATEYDAAHKRWCNAILGSLLRHGVSNATFGRAAKLIAVYLKAMVVIGPYSESTLAAIAHPPIDRILPRNLSQAEAIQSPHKQEWSRIKWTTLDEQEYYDLIGQLRDSLQDGEPMWHLERYWTPTGP
jgi:hypothetical protein